LVVRETHTLRSNERRTAAVVSKYELTARGKEEAQAIIARTTEPSEKTEA
jgi:hypothetical protein